MNYWLLLGRTADILGIASFFISIITLCVTAGIKKAQRHQVEKSDYSVDVDNQIETLQAFHDLAILEGGFDGALVLELEETLIYLEVFYETLLPKSLKAEIKGLRKYIKGDLAKNQSSNKPLKELARRLTMIMAQLKKVKKLL